MQIKLDSVVKSGIKTRFASNKKRGCLLVLSATWSVVSLVGILGGTLSRASWVVIDCSDLWHYEMGADD